MPMFFSAQFNVKLTEESHTVSGGNN